MKKSKEPEPPTRWLRSRTGSCYAYVVHTKQRDWRNVKLYRLRYLGTGVTSPKLWSMQDLTDSKCRWLKRRPTKKMIATTL